MNEDTGFMLAAMAKETRRVLEMKDAYDELYDEADRALISLLKSMAIHGFKQVTKEHE